MAVCDNPDCAIEINNGEESTVIGYMYEEHTYCPDCKVLYDNMVK